VIKKKIDAMSAQPLKGQLFIISAPSGVGKTTLIHHVREEWPEIHFSISFTTRAPRPKELPGTDYHFVSREEFQQGIQTGRFLEWAQVHGEYYGTERYQLETWLDAGQDVLLDIDVKGASQVRCSHPEAQTIFIVPPSLETLRERLQQRNTESDEQLRKRLAAAQKELQHAPWFDFIIVNDRLEDALADLKSILKACRCLRFRQASGIKHLLETQTPANS
jgi:guanylate kinase